MKNPQGLSRQLAGQSFFEVIVAIGLMSIVLITLVAMGSASIRASVFSKNQIGAVRYSQQALEWLRAEKDATWTNFKSKSLTLNWCLDSLAWLKPGSCSETDIISGTIFTRSLKFTSLDINTTQADVLTTWADAQGTHSVPASTVFTNWSSTIAVTGATPVAGPTATPGPTSTPTPTPSPVGQTPTPSPAPTPINPANYQPTANAKTYTGTNYTSVNNSALNIAQNITVSFWMKMTAIQDGDIFSKGGTGGYVMWVVPQSNQLWWGQQFSPIANWVQASIPTLNNWVQVTDTYDGVTLKIYYNGQLVAQNNASFTFNNAGTLTIGAGVGPNDDGYFIGILDQFRIYNRTLSASEIQSIMTGNPPLSGVVYSF